MVYIGLIIISFLMAFLVIPLVIRVLHKMELSVQPGGRKIHTASVPAMGGIGILGAAFFTILIGFEMEVLIQVRYLLAAAMLMFFVGLRDDVVDLTAIQKLGGQLVASFMVVVMGDIRFTSLFGFFGVTELPLVVSYLMTFFTIIVLTNAFNLIDGLDGLAGTISVLTFSFLGWWFYQASLPAYAMFSLVMVGAVGGFLVYNWHPAKIFMGDTGSLSLGFVLSVLTILFIDTNGKLLGDIDMITFNAPIATGIALLIVPVYDTARIFTKRILAGKSPMSPDKSHVHHFLLRMGLRHDQVTLVLASIKMMFIGLLFLGSSFNDYVMLPVVIGTSVLLGLWMDFTVLNKVKKETRKKPRVLQKAAMNSMNESKKISSPSSLRRMKINDN
jgi:UDP-GlcNAc:undecaprenyl-phosphate/decaprenyl-phosphate GlcNAc-1-phosphate transferase